MVRVAILTASDKGVRGEREDKSAEVIREMVAQLGWQVVEYKIVPDDLEKIKEALIEFSDRDKVELVFTTGGTGFSPRDNTPEATLAVVQRLVPGLPEAMRLESLKKTPRAMLSRAVAGIRHRTLIVNLPGSPRAVKECLNVILPSLPHGLEVLSGQAVDCARE